MNLLDIGIILAYFAGMIFLGLIAQKMQKNSDDYYVGGRSMGSFKIGALWMAGWIGGSAVIGTSANACAMGITAIWYVAAIAAGCIIFAFVMAEPIKRVSTVLHNITFPELIRSRYDEKNSLMCSITTIMAMIGYTAAQFVAGASILNVLTGWSLGLCYVVAAVVIVFYVSTGGHGNNKGMISHLKSANQSHDLHFSVLQVLSKSIPDHQIIEAETLWKKKLLTYEPFGMNQN